jgi:ATP-binding cassette subfamily C (CFTR/MRP) protein 1
VGYVFPFFFSALLLTFFTFRSGKSSLLQGLVGEMRRTSGSVKFSSSSVAYSQQSAWITNSTLRDNVLFGQAFDSARYWDCCRAACLLDDFDQLPAGDLTEIGEKGIALSGGCVFLLYLVSLSLPSYRFHLHSQRQRVSIARVLYSDRSIVLLDDPLSAVDAHVGAHIFEHAIRGVLKHKTVVLATHALSYLSQASSIIVMENGKIVEQGDYTKLVAANSNFSRFMLEHGVTSAVDAKTEQEKAIAPKIRKEKKAGAGGEGAKGKPLMTKEEQASGSIGLRTWGAYSKAAKGWVTVPLVLLSLVAMGASQGASASLFLSFRPSSPFPLSPSSLHTVLSNFALIWWQQGTFGLKENGFIGLYSGLGIATAIFTFTMVRSLPPFLFYGC